MSSPPFRVYYSLEKFKSLTVFLQPLPNEVPKTLHHLRILNPLNQKCKADVGKLAETVQATYLVGASSNGGEEDLILRSLYTDCFLKIFSYLNQKERVRLTQTWRGFRKVTIENGFKYLDLHSYVDKVPPTLAKLVAPTSEVFSSWM